MLKTLFVVGTDTDCGKTYVTVALLDYFRKNAQRARALKPVVSGCREENSVLVSDDVLCLQAANGMTAPPISRWMLAPPIAPHLAAKAAGITITAAEVMAFCQNYPSTDLDCLLIEGAGGLMVPLNDEETWVNFLILSKSPVILVVGMRLGCINHTLLTAEVLKAHGIACVGWVANFLDPEMLAQEENLHTLMHQLPCPLLGRVGYQGVFEPNPGGWTLAQQ